jgi:hypothetical protein
MFDVDCRTSPVLGRTELTKALVTKNTDTNVEGGITGRAQMIDGPGRVENFRPVLRSGYLLLFHLHCPLQKYIRDNCKVKLRLEVCARGGKTKTVAVSI